MTYRRILIALVVALMSLAVAVPMAAARESSPFVRQQLGEIGAWAVPSASQSGPSRAQVRDQLGEIGAWAVPSAPKPAASSGNGFDWRDAGLGVALAVGTLVLATLVSIRRRHHRPVTQ